MNDEATTVGKDMLRVSTSDGKYTVVQDASGKQFALRYGEPWQNLVGNGLTLALAHDLEEAREAVKALVALIEDGVLVRDTSGDGDAVAFMTQGLRIVKVLAQAREVLDATTEAKPEATP